jgi:hypothetical protein
MGSFCCLPGSDGAQTEQVEVTLLDLLPEYRRYPGLREHPVLTAFIARYVT